MSTYKIRTDCREFEAKENEFQRGDCQTDGHYLCDGCKHIAPFEKMELWDNKTTHYPEEAKAEKEAFFKGCEIAERLDCPFNHCDNNNQCIDKCQYDERIQHVSFPNPPDKETIEAVNHMAELAAKLKA